VSIHQIVQVVERAASRADLGTVLGTSPNGACASFNLLALSCAVRPAISSAANKCQECTCWLWSDTYTISPCCVLSTPGNPRMRESSHAISMIVYKNPPSVFFTSVDGQACPKSMKMP
jgi:hypothetical protein